MALSQTPRRKKALFAGLGVVALAFVLTVIVTVRQRQVNADVATSGATLENLDKTMSVVVKTVDANGAGVKSFLDANIDTNGNCTVDADEASTGTVGETEDDGTGTLDLLYDTNYTITASSEADVRKGTQGVAIGNSTTTTCAKAIAAPNSDPLPITVK